VDMYISLRNCKNCCKKI